MISVFTATNNPRWLRQTWESLKNQQNAPTWEWLLLLNGGATRDELPPEVLTDPRARVLIAPKDCEGSIGALKRHLCGQAAGELLVELDHDDRLASNCLAELAQAAAATPNAFYYSDPVYETPDGKFHTWTEQCGWQSYTANVDGKDRLATRFFDATPRSICEGWWSPDHVRAWSRSAYDLAGGHDPKIIAADDFDLIQRTYLAGVEFVHVQKPLYIYRWNQGGGGASNQASPLWGKIQETIHGLRNKNLYAICIEYSRRHGLDLLDLGGAHNNDPRFRPVDVIETPNGIKCDIAAAGLPVPENSCGAIRAWDFLEHVPPARVPFVMNEIYRALAPGGFLLSRTPSTDGPNGEAGRGAFQDPTHVSFWNENSFWYYTHAGFRQYVPAITCRFQAVRVVTHYPSKWHEQNRIPYVDAELSALKGQRQPGAKNI